MTILCDTQAYIWAIQQDARLTEKAREMLSKSEIEIPNHWKCLGNDH
jgi:PIN domain nuclease of toxin-antitoxin system